MTIVDTHPAPSYVPVVAERQNDIIRSAILAEYHKRKLNPYRLWKLVEGKVSRATVYAFVGGETTLTTETATHFLQALGLSLKQKK